MTDIRPVVGGDIGTWGTKLLTWLGVSINPDGTLISGAELAYQPVTTDVVVQGTVESTPKQLIDFGSVAFDGSPCQIDFWCPRVSISNATGVYVVLYEDGTVSGGTVTGGTELGRMVVRGNPASGSWLTDMPAQYRFTPSAGTHHYRIASWVSNSAGATFAGNTGGTGNELPMYGKITNLSSSPSSYNASVAPQMIAMCRYAPTPGTVFGPATVGSLPPVAISASNLSVSFNLARESNLIVRLQAWHDTLTLHASHIWALLEGGTMVPGSGALVDRTVQINSNNTGDDNPYAGDTGKFTGVDIYLSNVAPGSHTYQWAWYDGDNMRLFCGDGTTADGSGHIWAPAYMFVSTVPV